MKSDIFNILRESIDNSSRNNDYTVDELIDLFDLFNKHRYQQYAPTKQSSNPFMQRLREWLSCIHAHMKEEKHKDVDTLTFDLLLSLKNIIFISEKESDSLIISLWKEVVIPYIEERYEINPFMSECSQKSLSKQLSHTQFIRVTDSMDIKKLFHLNNFTPALENITLSQEFRDMKRSEYSGKAAQLANELSKKNVSDIVITEDLVGSGEQSYTMINACVIEFTKKGIKSVFAPLITLSCAYIKYKELERGMNAFTFRPVIHFDERFSVNPESVRNDEPRHHKVFRDMSNRLYASGDYNDVFGFQNCGSYIVQHTNCPNNSLLLLRDDRIANGLFPRNESTTKRMPKQA